MAGGQRRLTLRADGVGHDASQQLRQAPQEGQAWLAADADKDAAAADVARKAGPLSQAQHASQPPSQALHHLHPKAAQPEALMAAVPHGRFTDL